MQHPPTATVLVVEDDELTALATVSHLEAGGYTVLGPCRSAEEALARVTGRRPDLVLMDIGLAGEIDGIEAAGLLREQGIPVAFLTAHIADDLLRRASAVQPIAYLVKPLNPVQLHATVTTALEQTRLQRDLDHMQRRARDSERRLASLVGNLPGMIYRVRHHDGVLLYASEGCLGLTGYAAAEFISSAVRYADLIHPEDRERVAHRIETALAEGRPYRLMYRLRDRLGREKWVWEQGRRCNDDSSGAGDLEGLIIDISDQKHIEQTLEEACFDLKQRVELRTLHLSRLNEELEQEIRGRETLNRALQDSEERYRALVETLSDWVWEVNARGEYIYVSPRVRDLLGYEPEEMLGRTPFDFMPAAEAERVAAVFAGLAQEHRPIDRLENVNRHKDGRLVVLETSGMPVLVNGELAGYRGVDRDITERRKMESALRASEERLSAILRHTMAVTYLKDLEGRYVMVNPAFERLVGMAANDIIGHTDAEIFPAELAQRFHANDRYVLEVQRCDTFEEELDIGGERRVYLSVKFPLYDERGDRYALCGMSTDITERLRQADRERDLLIREVHHRIKNHLQGMIGLLRQQQVSGPELVGVMDNLVGKVQSIATVYGLKSRAEAQSLSLRTMVEAICHQVRDLYQAQIHCSRDEAAGQDVRITSGESVPLALILNELLVNAVKHAEADDPRVEVRIDAFGDGLLVRISNAGCLPETLDWDGGRGLGTGLRLLRSLMPHRGAGLRYRQSGSRVITEFLLVEPLVCAA